METKICSKCKVEKMENEFSPSDFVKSGGWCKLCNKEYKKAYYEANKNSISEANKSNYISNRDEILARNKLYNEINKDAINKWRRTYKEINGEAIKNTHMIWRNNNADTIAKKKSVYYQKNKTKIKNRECQRYQDKKEHIKETVRTYEKKRSLSDPVFRLRKGVSRSIRLAIQKDKSYKSITKHLSYTIKELKEHLEKQFEPWMTWDNWGAYNKDSWDDNDSNTWKWQIDHIIPHSTFQYMSMEDESFQKCWALYNLRPISAKTNVHDNNKGFGRQKRGLR
jgi:hypothetical protein